MVGYMVKAEEYETCYEGRSTTFRQGEPERVTENLVELMKNIVSNYLYAWTPKISSESNL